MRALDLPDARLPGVDHRARRDRLRTRLGEADVPALFVTDVVNVRWLSGLSASNAQLLVAADPDLDLLCTDGRYATQAHEQSPDLPCRVVRSGTRDAVERVAEAGLAGLGFEADHLVWLEGERLRDLARERGLEATPTTGHVEALRAVKDEHELAAVRAACTITDRAFSRILEVLAPGISERDVAVILEHTMVDLGAEAPAFETIVASGPNSAIPHHRPTARRLAPGDLVKLDFGARYAGYHADMTRTVAVGKPHPELTEIHDLVRRAQAAGVDAAVAGAAVGEVDRACRDLIAAAGRGAAFVHPTGHGVGLAIHEWPTLAQGGRATLAAGMTVTVEPGVYLPGLGGVRIEDTVAVAAGERPEVLTASPRDLVVL